MKTGVGKGSDREVGGRTSKEHRCDQRNIFKSGHLKLELNTDSQSTIHTKFQRRTFYLHILPVLSLISEYIPFRCPHFKSLLTHLLIFQFPKSPIFNACVWTVERSWNVGENPCRHGQNMQTPHRKAPGSSLL